jgi:acyl dehydratase
MPTPLRIETDDNGLRHYHRSSHRRTLTESDIVGFVNLVGLHEPPFIDMDWVASQMPGSHAVRFAPAPLLISLGMGLMATYIMDIVDALREAEGFGAFHGMVGVQARVRSPAFVGDTLEVSVDAHVDRTTSAGQTLVDLDHVVRNQHGQVVVEFTEKVLFEPAG